MTSTEFHNLLSLYLAFSPDNVPFLLSRAISEDLSIFVAAEVVKDGSRHLAIYKAENRIYVFCLALETDTPFVASDAKANINTAVENVGIVDLINETKYKYHGLCFVSGSQMLYIPWAEIGVIVRKGHEHNNHAGRRNKRK